MIINITVREIIDCGRWDELCELKGLNPWGVNEGLINTDEVIELTDDEARILRII